MLGRKERDQLELFITGSLRSLVPDDHVLVKIDHVLDLGWLRAEVADLYCAENGRPGIDPEVAVRLMLAGFLLGIVHDRRLMREAQVNLAIRWFVGYGLHEALPDHSSLTRIRQRWGEAVFRTVFTRVVQQCQAAGLVTAETVHIDASLIRADVSMDALVARHLDAVETANDAERTARKSDRFKKLCRTDPDATMATSSKAPLRPAYKQHTAVDDQEGVVVDVTPQACLRHDEIVRSMTRAGSKSASTPSKTQLGLPRTGSRRTRSMAWGGYTPRLNDARSKRSFRPFAPRAAGARRALRPDDSSSIPITTLSGVRRRSGSNPVTARNPASGIVPTGATARVALSRHSACRKACHPVGCISSPTMRPSCGPGANARHGVTKNTRSTPATAGGWKARTAPPRRFMD
jgi:transposase